MRKVSIRILFVQFLVAASVFLIFSVYVWFLQLKYDGAKVGYERALFYALLVFGAGFSYDSAKRVMFMPQSQFKEFWKHLREALAHMVFIICLVSASAFLFNVGYTLPGQLAYLFALGWLWFLLSSSTSALEIAAKVEVAPSLEGTHPGKSPRPSHVKR
jgi:hypothetical protein